MGDDITIGVTEIVNNIEVTAQPNDQIIDISVVDNSDEVTLNVTPNVVEVNINKGSSFARWGTIYGNLTDQTDLTNALFNKADLVDGKVPSYQLPSFVDDVIEVANFTALPTVGEIGKIYITLDNNKIYRWSGSIYIEIASNQAVWGTITGSLNNQTDLVNALDLKANDADVVKLTGNQTITGTKSFNSSTSVGIRQNNSGSGYGIYSENASNGFGYYVANNGSGKAISVANALGSFGNMYEGSYNGVNNFFVDYTGKVNAPIFELQPNNTVSSNPNYIGQQMATNDSWKIYGNTIALDRGELVFELGDNAFSSSVNGQRFRFHYENSSGGTAKSPFILDYNDATFNTNASFAGVVTANAGSFAPSFIAIGNSNNNGQIQFGTSINYSIGSGSDFGGMDFTVAGSTKFSIKNNGNVIINSLGTGLVYSNAGTLTSTNPSDERLKDDITDLQYGLNEILQLRPVTYNWKNDTINQGKQFGFIAQEVQEVMPELISEFETKDGEEDVIRLGLDKEGIYVTLVNAIKELKAEIDLLKQK